MSRSEAIEAAARALLERGGIDWDVADGRAKNAARRGAEKALTAAAPHIESALLDRIEEAVKGLADQADRYAEVALKQFQREQDAHRDSRARAKLRSCETFRAEAHTYREVIAVLSEIREEGK